MKIIQIVGGGTTSDGDGAPLYGLGDDGVLYEFVEGHEPNRARRYVGPATTDVYIDGETRGWKPVVTSDARSKVVPHPEDPTRHERS